MTIDEMKNMLLPTLLVVTSNVKTRMHNFMSSLGRYRLILDRESSEPYLDRYYLLFRDRQTFPFNIFLHHFRKSDPDVLHDHPWSYHSLVLLGGYWEHTETGKTWRGPFSYKYAPASTLHRVELDSKAPNCWTLFIPTKKQRDWGFKTENGWVQHERYLDNRRAAKPGFQERVL